MNLIPDFLKSTRVYGVIGFVSWVLFVFLELIKAYSSIEHLPLAHSTFLINLIFAIFCISVFAFYKFEIEKKKYDSYTDLLWRSLITSIIALTVLVLSKLYIKHNEFDADEIEWVENTFYHLNISSLIIMLSNTFFIFKKMSLYLKNKFIDKTWRFLGWSVSISTIFCIFDLQFTNIFFQIVYAILSLGLIFASFHIKWVAFFNYKQKLFSMIILFLILTISLIFFEYFYDKSKNIQLLFDVTNNIFVMSLLTFSITYPLLSVLVILFNLPTSSVFENKLGEVKNFQKISQGAQAAKSENEIYESLLVGCFSSINANFSALMIFNTKKILFFESIGIDFSKDDILCIKSILRKNSIKTDNGTHYIKNLTDLKHSDLLQKEKIKSLLWIPLKANNELLGYMIIGSKIKDAFEKDGIEIIETYTNQASLSIKYSRLIEEKVHTERYKEALNIAEKVQKSLLPKSIASNTCFDISTYYKTAEEVGGDYYDYYKISDTKHAIIIADVSGKGTSAAFYTAQLKGVFMSLIHFDLPIDTLVLVMNEVLKDCLDKKNFITLTIVFIDTLKNSITHIRAGHCPILYYNSVSNSSEFLKPNGFGIGMVNTEIFTKYLEVKTTPFNKDDVFLLYTDGLIEAKNNNSEEFGYEFLNQTFEKYVKGSTPELINGITKEFITFISTNHSQDDCTIIAIKIK